METESHVIPGFMFPGQRRKVHEAEEEISSSQQIKAAKRVEIN